MKAGVKIAPAFCPNFPFPRFDLLPIFLNIIPFAQTPGQTQVQGTRFDLQNG